MIYYNQEGKSHIERMGLLIGHFENNLEEEPGKILFCGHGLKCFSPLRGINFKTTNYLLSFVFGSVPCFITAGTGKAPTVNLLRLNTLKEVSKPLFNP